MRTFVAAALACFAAVASGVQNVQTGQEMEELWKEQRLFELQALLASATASTPDVLFYRGMVANAFNQPAASVDVLTSFLQAHGDKMPRDALKDALSVLDDDYARMFQYAKCAEIRDRLLPLVRTEMSRSELSGFRSISELWRRLASARPQTVDIPGDTEIRMTEAGEVPAVINDVELAFLPDTGSALSMIVLSDAERLGLEILDLVVEVGTSTGKTVRARPCVMPEMRLGAIRVRDAIFLVVPDGMLYFPEIRAQRHGLMGFPILNGLKEFAFTTRRRFLVNSPPRLEGPPNIFLARTDPVVEARYEGQRLLFFLDTGAFKTELSPRFFKAFAVEIMKNGRYAPATIEGVGTRARAPVYLMPGLTFRVAGRDVTFTSPLPVLTRSSGAFSDNFDGSFSLDILTGREELTLNYGAMKISLR